ncbi:uncharacterized protein LOC114828138 [Galendromus occidentalis]|uniref:Uncharacterized protein LOC114828138 n=1 Tax=Galendromus occidentalis TaxID=34638 RepID=A0AAJ7SFD7_9ACAR|nr:uncharacterized protein LOC114828138 [Galendromus occidentalis]
MPKNVVLLCAIFGFLSSAESQGMGEVLGKVRGAISKGRVAAGIAAKFVPCFRLLSEIQDNMKKVTYNSKGLRMCLEKAIPRDEDIEGKDNVYVTKDEMRTKIKTCVSSMIAAARGKNVDDDDVLVDVKDCFMEAGQSLSALSEDGKDGGKEGH